MPPFPGTAHRITGGAGPAGPLQCGRGDGARSRHVQHMALFLGGMCGGAPVRPTASPSPKWIRGRARPRSKSVRSNLCGVLPEPLPTASSLMQGLPALQPSLGCPLPSR